jgi:hypothetical protein
MHTLTQQLQTLEAQALQLLHSVDLATPLEQLHMVFEALLEVPTTERRSDTAFARQASGALEVLLERLHKLLALGCVLTEHVGSTMVPVPHSTPFVDSSSGCSVGRC